MKFLIALALGAASATAAPKSVRVFVALCDNKTQGIQPVGEKIGNGDDPAANLYWGCDDGFGAFLLHDMIEVWKRGGSTADLREAGGRAYARNQKISVAAGTNIFAPPKQKRGAAPALPATPQSGR